MQNNRRQFLKTATAFSVMAAISCRDETKAKAANPFSCSSYSWFTFYERQKKKWNQAADECIADFANSGFTAIEPGFEKAEEAEALLPFLKKYNIAIPSVYVGGAMHTKQDANNTIEQIIKTVALVKPMGTKVITTNPYPLAWGANQFKTEEQLKIQVDALNHIGAALRKNGITLAYHTHQYEFLAGAREFHHMMLNTSPSNLSFCFDVHWAYRGCENSSLAVFDILKLYGNRIVSLHIRQSANGIWTETIGTGDIDYVRLANELKELKEHPLIVAEQCLEAASPHTMDAVTAHRQNLASLKNIFGA